MDSSVLMWQKNGSGSINAAKLANGLETFHEIASSGHHSGYAPATVEEALALIKSSDEDNDEQKLNKMEFTCAMVRFANACKVDVHELN